MPVDYELLSLKQQVENLRAMVTAPKRLIDILKLNAREVSISGYSDSAAIVMCFCDASETPLSPVLPNAHLDNNIMFIIIKSDSSANAVTVLTVGGQTINGLTSKTLGEQNAGVMLVSDRSNWLLVSELPAKWS